MATRVIDGVVHHIDKIERGFCDTCEKEICVGWKVWHNDVSKGETTRHCYDCTNNQWAKALKLHKNETHK